MLELSIFNISFDSVMTGFHCGEFVLGIKLEAQIREVTAVMSPYFQVDGTPRGWRQLKHLKPCLDS